MRHVQWILLAIFSGVLFCASYTAPESMAQNAFLLEFVNHEYINVVAVIVTVSLVSVTQIHLEYSRIERRFETRVFQEAREEINLGAVILTSMLVLAFVISFVRAEVLDNDFLLSLTHSATLLTVVVSIFIMYDFVRTVYVLAAEEPIEEDDPEEPPQE